MLLSSSQAEQLSKSRKTFLVTTYHPSSRSLYVYLDCRVDDKVDAGDEEGQEPETPGEGAPPVATGDAQLRVCRVGEYLRYSKSEDPAYM